MPSRRNLRLASFDGGGPRSFSQLYIMQNLMHRLRWDVYPNDPDKEMLPCDYFDLIGGSDTGGLIAIMFVKLRMSVEEVIAEFGTIVEEAYANDLEPRERTERLKKSLEALIARRSLPIDAKLRDDGRNGHCAGFTLAAHSANVGSKLCLRTYPVRSQPSSTITILDAALATCASPSEFLPVSFGTGYQRQEFIGAGLAASNPVRYVINEAQTLFGGDSVVASLLSLGSGHPGIISLSPDGGIDALHRLTVEMMLDCEQKAQEIQQQIGQVGIYFRFSVEQGMQRGRQPPADELSSISAQTASYLATQETTEKLDHYVHSVKSRVGIVSLNQLSRISGLTPVASERIARINDTQRYSTSGIPEDVTQSRALPLSRTLHQTSQIFAPNLQNQDPGGGSHLFSLEEDQPVVPGSSLDLIDHIRGMFRLLDLVHEQGSGGVVDTIVLAQESIKAFANQTRQGSYRSVTHVDFRALDSYVIKPRGIYGSAPALTDFLHTVCRMDSETRRWLLRPSDEHSGVTIPTLRPGLYLVRPANGDPSLAYIVFWPEAGTWNDRARLSVSRNRVLFMRYLTKLCDQIDCLISDNDAARLVWRDEGAAKNARNDDYDRIFGYTVEQPNEEKESAEAEAGFIIRHRSIEEIDHPPEGYPANRGLEVLQSQLVVGETTQAIMETRFIPEVKITKVDDMPGTLALEDLLSANRSPIVVLKDNIDRVSLEIVLNYGLWKRCGGLQREWKERLANGPKEEADAWAWLRGEVRRRLSNSIPKNNNGTKLTIEAVSHILKTYGRVPAPSTFHIKGWVSSPQKAGFEYTLFPLQVTRDDILAISSDPGHLCKPVVRSDGLPQFFLPFTASVRFIRLLEKGRAFVIIEELEWFRVYLESIDCLASTISQGKAIKSFYSEKLGVNCLFALDETKCLLVILGTTATIIRLYTYAYDLVDKSLYARGGAVDLTRWYQGVPQFAHLLFVSGTEELLFVEKGGFCRIFSLVMENFRPSNLRLAGEPESSFSSSDGACLLLKMLEKEGPRLLCYHWASFGSREGTEIPWPSQIPGNAPMAVSSVGSRQGTYIILMARREGFCQSLRVRITSKSSEFVFRSNTNNTGQSGASKKTVNNSLIDCHAEVWTRFPVNAAIVKTTVATAVPRPRSVLFVSRAASAAFAPYFNNMIRNFEYQTRKSMKEVLKQTIVRGSQDWKASSPNILTSELQLGDWLVGLFCLIPIHLAVTRSNRFIPLKDGVDSPQFEQGLLGANVAQISEALSFGWYESIFSSYLANKPVKVVTSMGEQSVGKRFALNHFVDTSFAGSAMRCTEGVWLSVTPTKEYLVVAMDFEGVHSIERSPQEDTLLVLLNAAIPNFVLFRNNLPSLGISPACSIFQSCTKVLNPKENPSLFHSTLGIIIKDVIDSDTREIVNEFQRKFQRIVQKERADSFISKLHRGKLDIIPWPVIESARFYDLFVGLKKRLDRQEITHKHAGAFLGVLKMLMAKLKANDWGALDQNLAVQRAQQLTSLLPFALAFGTTDPINDEPLKNYDTDEQLDNTEQRDTNDSFPAFFLEGLSHPIHGRLSLDSCLEQLRLRWENRKERYSMSEREFVDGYNDYLRILAEARVNHVRDWIAANTSRFGENAEVTSLRRTFDQLSKELKAFAVLCGSKCSSCELLCLEHKQHEGDHNCMTDHKCPEICGFADEHEDDVACGLPAGHIGRHVCSGTPHLCGMQCQMYGNNGCLITCTKPIGHDDSEWHQCAVGLHTCGEICSLVQEDGTRLCHRACNLDCRIDHELHTCDRSLSCPIKCQLCNSYCAVGDHFHALKPNAVHLCGQKHDCDQLCELDGVCEINTIPQSIESIFVGRYATFQYTKYFQEARRLRCVIPLGADQLKHDGPHVHSNDSNPFHYCEACCKGCGYYCTYPLGHCQPEHSTNHGITSQTEWLATKEVNDRKYATGDSGYPELCSLVCESLGRHVHVASCRPDEDGNCVGAELEHMAGSSENKDRITHRLYWMRSGFEDPYSQEKRDEFMLCDHRCPGPEHDADNIHGAAPSYCTLPLFHGTPDPSDAPPLGHISNDGHAYGCKSPDH